MSELQIVIDTNVLFAGLYSNRGASYRLLSLLDSGKFEINLSVPLTMEYEEVLKRNHNKLGLTTPEVDQFLENFGAIANWHEIYFLWRPVLKDQDDDMILELAVKARCDYIITYNKQDFMPAKMFGVTLATSREFLKRIHKI